VSKYNTTMIYGTISSWMAYSSHESDVMGYTYLLRQSSNFVQELLPLVSGGCVIHHMSLMWGKCWQNHNYWESKAVLAYSAHQLDENYMTKLWLTVTDSSDQLIWLMWGRHDRTATYWGSTRRGTWERSSSVSADETTLLCQLSGSWEPVNKLNIWN